MRRRKDQLVDMTEFSLSTPRPETDQDKIPYKKKYHKTYKERYKQKTKTIRIEVSNEEHQRLKSVAKSENKPLSKLVLEGFYAYEKKEMVHNKSNREIIYHLSKIGNNLNQITAKLHTTKNLLLNSPKKQLTVIKQMLGLLLDHIESSRHNA